MRGIRLVSSFPLPRNDEHLDELRAQWDNLEGILDDMKKQTLETLPFYANVSVEFIAHVGYHVVISKSEARFVSMNDDLEFSFDQINDIDYLARCRHVLTNRCVLMPIRMTPTTTRAA